MSPALEKERIDHQILNPIFSGTEPDRDTLAEYQIHLAAFFCISVPECLGRGVGKHPEKLWVKIPNYFCLSAYYGLPQGRDARMDAMPDFDQLQLRFVDHVQWRYELIRPV